MNLSGWSRFSSFIGKYYQVQVDQQGELGYILSDVTSNKSVKNIECCNFYFLSVGVFVNLYYFDHYYYCYYYRRLSTCFFQFCSCNNRICSSLRSVILLFSRCALINCDPSRFRALVESLVCDNSLSDCLDVKV